MNNLDWIKKGNTGCVFATFFAKNPELIRWKNIFYTDFCKKYMWKEDLVIQINFPFHFSREDVKKWSLKNGFFIEETSFNTEGLRIQCKEGVAWV